MPSRSVAGNLANMGHSSVSSRERSTGSVAQIKCCPVAGSSFSRAHHQLSPQVRLLTCPVLLSVFTYLVVAALIFPFVVAYGTQTHHYSGPRIPTIKEHPSSIVVKKQKPVTLSCKADGEPVPIIEWYKDNELVHKSPNYIFLTNGDLFILKVTNHKKEKDTGTFYCLASNQFGQAQSHNATVEIASIRDEFRILPKNVLAAVGDVAVLECSPPRGYPDPEVKWKKDGEFVSTDSRIRLSAGNLIVSDVQPEDAGRYQCLAQNMGGSRESPPAQLTVRVKPYFVRRPEDVTALSNEVAEIHCKVAGDPPPKVTWRRENGKIATARTIISEDKSMRISQVTEEDEGIYVCEAENLVGQISSFASLVVHSRPNFLIEPKDIRASVNGVARFECVATGNPRPSVFWTKEGNQILMFPDNKYGRFSVTPEGSLLISTVKKEDAGFYICSALSVVGSSTAKAYLNISSSADIPPPLIIIGPADQTFAQHSTAFLPCEATGTPFPTLSWLFNSAPIQLSDERFTVLDTGTLQIEDLQVTDSGNYQCVVRSENGHSTWSASLRVVPAHSTNTMFHRMPDPSTFPDAPSRPNIVNSTETSITISWRRTGRDGASPVISTIVEYFSPDHSNEWIRVSEPVLGDVVTVHELKSSSRYYFLVRAKNSHGIGLPSAISNEARTLGHESYAPVSSTLVDLTEARRKLEGVVVELKDVRAINSSVVKLFWEVRGNQEFVEGFYVRYRAIDPENFATDPVTEHYSMVVVYNGGASSYVLSNLPKFNIFEFFLVPFYKSIDGQPSNTRIVRTLEDVPSVPPGSIKAQPVSSSSALVSWQPPTAEKINGLLLGYKLYVHTPGAYRPYNVNLTVNANTTSYLLRNLSTETEYVIQVMAFTAVGNGPSSPPLTFIMDPLLSSDVFTEKADTSNVWICVLIISLIILSLIVLLLGVLLYKKRNSILKKSSDGLAINREMKSQSSSLYGSQWQYSWKTNSRHPSDSKPTGSNTLKISSSFHPSDQNGYSTVTTEEQAADYAEVSQADNNYETAYYATSTGISSDSPVAYASSSIISGKAAPYGTNGQTWQPTHNWTTQLAPKSKHTFSTIDRHGLNQLYFADGRSKKGVECRDVNSFAKGSLGQQQQGQPLITSSNDYEDASLFYADSSAYSANNITQIPSSKLITNQYKYGSLSRANSKNTFSPSQLNSFITNDTKKKGVTGVDWESSSGPSRDIFIGHPSPRGTLNRAHFSRAQMEIESTYKPSGLRHIIANPLIERAHGSYRSPSFGDKLDEACGGKHGPVHYFTMKDKAIFGKGPEPAMNTLASCDTESCYQELP